MAAMEVVGIQAAHWVLSKALGPVSSGVLEAWADSYELGPNVEALKMELLYAQGTLNNARGRAHHQEIQNPALTELLHKLRGLAYRADDVLDELDYFRIQDELDGTYHATDEHDGGCLRNQALNARRTAKAIVKMLGFSKCSRGSPSHDDKPDEDTRGVTFGACPCLGLTNPDEEEQEEEASRGVLCGAVWPCGGRASATPPIPPTTRSDPEVADGCISRLASSARDTIHAVGKHLPCNSLSSGQNDANSNTASSAQRFLCCGRPNKETPTRRERVAQAPKLKFDRVEMSRTLKELVEQLKPVCAKVSTILNLELLDSNRSIAHCIYGALDAKFSNKQWHAPLHKDPMSRPMTDSKFVEPKFQGREGEIREIIDDITKGKYCDKDLAILPVVGPGGVGKTTLVQYILYNSKELHTHFEVKLWVCVSSVNFNVHALTQKIANELGNDSKNSPDKLIEERLNSKRFLLVLDGMWDCSNEDAWERFLVPFRRGQTKGNVILVTTRIPQSAQKVKTTEQWKDLKGLDTESFDKLFLACIFGDEQPPDDNTRLINIGNQIKEKLKGSPLAAKTVGRLLKQHIDLDHWTRVLESKEWQFQNGENDIMPALKLSFDYLPFDLQQCFIYCALFPEDYKFSKEELIQQWIGLDVLHSHGENKIVEDVGLRCLTELVNHGFFEVENDEHGRTYYIIHDLLHDLALFQNKNALAYTVLI